jgi:adenylate cyclase
VICVMVRSVNGRYNRSPRQNWSLITLKGKLTGADNQVKHSVCPCAKNPMKLQLDHVPVEIERKFLVANDEWRQSAVSSVSIRDGLIAVYKDRKVRVRISGDTATFAIKGPRIGIVRPEFEYEIPIADAERMLSTLCQDDTLEKQRFFVEDADATWYVDVYGGLLQGVIIAEIELKQERQELILPRWIGKEVTGDPFYKKINMRARALKAHDRRR